LKLDAFDSHAHLDLEQFDPDREEVIARANIVGVTRINTVGIDIEGSRKSIALAERYPGILASVGIHPQEAHKVSYENIIELEKMARHPRVVAIGETGLDFYYCDSSRQAQVQALQWQMDLASKVGLPVIIHSRQAQESILPILKEWSDDHPLPPDRVRGVVHCYSGDLETATSFLSMGFFISFGAYIGYPSSVRLRETLKEIPLDKLLVETDCPFLPPQKMRGKRNEPSFIPITLGIMAGIKGISVDQATSQTTANACLLFNLEGRNLI
jgi:TatD DNase family protein